jgi:RNA polymerase sigma-70 factor (ECF subfamily)
MDPVIRLCDRAKSGDLGAASELVSIFYEKLFSYFRRLCGNEQDAEDLTQKTFLKVWSALSSFQGRSSFSTWIHGVAYHVYCDWRRRKSLSEFRSDSWWEACVAEGASPFEDAAEQDRAHQLYALVEKLAEGTREVVHLHYYQGLSLKETAEVLNIATSTVKYRLREGLEILRTQTAEPKAGIRLKTEHL